MRIIFDNTKVLEEVGNNYISYLLNENDLFSETGYKVLRNISNKGFVKCVQTLNNGKPKLFYDTSELINLQVLIKNIDIKKFFLIINNLLDVCEEVISNGFLKYENINNNNNRIYIDVKNGYKVKVIYLPINMDSETISLESFENIIKQLICNFINENINLKNDMTMDLCQRIFMNNIHFQDIKIMLNEYEKNQINLDAPFKKQEDLNDKVTDNYNMVNTIVNNDINTNGSVNLNEKQRKGLFRLFHKEMNDMIVLKSKSLISRESIVINKKEFIIGKNDIEADGVINQKMVSRKHCLISYSRNSFYVTDLKSLNGTFLNGIQLSPGKKEKIKIGDILKVADIEYIVERYQ